MRGAAGLDRGAHGQSCLPHPGTMSRPEAGLRQWDLKRTRRHFVQPWGEQVETAWATWVSRCKASVQNEATRKVSAISGNCPWLPGWCPSQHLASGAVRCALLSWDLRLPAHGVLLDIAPCLGRACPKRGPVSQWIPELWSHMGRTCSLFSPRPELARQQPSLASWSASPG